MKPWLARLLQRGLRWVGERLGPPPGAPQTPELPTATLPVPPADAPPKTCVTVVIPALNEAKRIARVVAYALADPATAEVVVVAYIKLIRAGRFKPGVVRLVIELKQEIRPQIFTLKPVGEYGHRLVIDLFPMQPADPLLALIEKGTSDGPAQGEGEKPGRGRTPARGQGRAHGEGRSQVGKQIRGAGRSASGAKARTKIRAQGEDQSGRQRRRGWSPSCSTRDTAAKTRARSATAAVTKRTSRSKSRAGSRPRSKASPTCAWR